MAKFQPGQSGNPQGKKKGTSNKRTQLAKLLIPHAEDLIAKVVELAKAGDVNALRICLDKLLPRPKDEAVEFELPVGDLKKNNSLLLVGERLIETVANGEISPEQAKTIAAVLDTQRKTIEIVEIEARLSELEKNTNHGRR